MQFFRRYRMELRLARVAIPPLSLPAGYHFVRWRPDLVERHAHVKFQSFRGEVDSVVFPCLGDLASCGRLMTDISIQEGFVPQATWLITRSHIPDDHDADCGTIQGLSTTRALGAIQNVGIIPEARGLGLGRALVRQALLGFREAGMKRVYLEVTAENRAAVALYRSVGFRILRTMYKAGAESPVGAA